MRRWIAFLLMIVLPLQLSWAVAANYCQDEVGAAAHHFGHHMHSHDGGHGKAAAKTLVKGKQQADRDCGCGGHLCGAHLLPAGIDQPLAPAQVAVHLSVAVLAYRSADPPRIERPNWTVSL